MRRAHARVVVTTLMLLAYDLTAQAQTPVDGLTPPASSESVRTAADMISWGAALANVALDTADSWHSAQKTHAFVKQGVRLGAAQLSAVALKRLVHRRRPCAPDCGSDDPDLSFPSGHTAMACASIGRTRLSFTIPLAIITAEGRILAKKHWLTDTLAGCSLGVMFSLIH